MSDTPDLDAIEARANAPVDRLDTVRWQNQADTPALCASIRAKNALIARLEDELGMAKASAAHMETHLIAPDLQEMMLDMLRKEHATGHRLMGEFCSICQANAALKEQSHDAG